MNKTLSYEERVKIEVLLGQKMKPYKIADVLGRCRQTIYNEIKRGSVTLKDTHLKDYTVYKADVGQRIKNIHLSGRGSDLKVGSCLSYIDRLQYLVKDLKLSPYSALMYIRNHNEFFPVSICTTTFYKYIHSGVFCDLTYKDLPYHRFHKKKKTEKRISWKNLECKSIVDRPGSADDRSEFGHFEGDLVCSGQSYKSCVLTLTDRMSRFELIRKIPNKTTASVYAAMKKLKKELEEMYSIDFFKSITFDNGVEFSGWKALEKLLGCSIYFAHPYCSSERGSNENCNRIIRRFIPKGCDIGQYSDYDIQRIENYINDMPRRILNGLSSEMFLERQYALSLPS